MMPTTQAKWRSPLEIDAALEVMDASAKAGAAGAACAQELAGQKTATYQQVVAAWNAQADETNQWDALGEDEKIEWALQCRDQMRGDTKMMRADGAASTAVAQAAGGAA